MEILSAGLHKAIGILLPMLPKWLARQFLPLSEIEKQFEIRLANGRIPTIDRKSGLPKIEIPMCFDNKARVGVTVDRILFEIWLSQPVFDGAYLWTETVEPGRQVEYRMVRFYLPNTQRSVLDAHLREGQSPPTLSIHFTAFCECRMGRFKVDNRFELYSPHYSVN